MDLYSIFEVSQHVMQHLHAITPILHDAWSHTSETVQNVSMAIVHEEAMPASERMFQTGKLAVSTFGCAFCLATGNFEGVAGFAIPEVEAFKALDQSGAQYRANHS